MDKITANRKGIEAEIRGEVYYASTAMGVQLTTNSHGVQVCTSAGALFMFDADRVSINGKMPKDDRQAIQLIVNGLHTKKLF